MALVKRLAAFDGDMGQRIMYETTGNDMIDELAGQLTDVIERHEKSSDEVKKKLKKALKGQQKKYEVDLRNQRDKLKERMKIIKEKDTKIVELEERLRDKDDNLELMNDKLSEAKSFMKIIRDTGRRLKIWILRLKCISKIEKVIKKH